MGDRSGRLKPGGPKTPGKYSVPVGPNYGIYGEQPGYVYDPQTDKYYFPETARKLEAKRKAEQKQVDDILNPPKQPGLAAQLGPIAAVGGAGVIANQLAQRIVSSALPTAAEKLAEQQAAQIAQQQAGQQVAQNTAANITTTGVNAGTGAGTSTGSGVAATQGAGAGGLPSPTITSATRAVPEPSTGLGTEGGIGGSGIGAQGGIAGWTSAILRGANTAKDFFGDDGYEKDRNQNATVGMGMTAANYATGGLAELGKFGLEKAIGKKNMGKLEKLYAQQTPIYHFMNAVGSGKSRSQVTRDEIRKVLQKDGILDKDFQGTLADGSKFDFGKDGKGFADVDFKDPLIQKIAALSNVITAGEGLSGQAAEDAANLYLRAAVSNAGGDLNKAIENIRHFAKQRGFNSENVTAQIEKLKNDGAITEEQYRTWLADQAQIFDPKKYQQPKQPQPQPGQNTQPSNQPTSNQPANNQATQPTQNTANQPTNNTRSYSGQTMPQPQQPTGPINPITGQPIVPQVNTSPQGLMSLGDRAPAVNYGGAPMPQPRVGANPQQTQPAANQPRQPQPTPGNQPPIGNIAEGRDGTLVSVPQPGSQLAGLFKPGADRNLGAKTPEQIQADLKAEQQRLKQEAEAVRRQAEEQRRIEAERKRQEELQNRLNQQANNGNMNTRLGLMGL